MLADLEPKHAAYARLIEARDHYREIVAAGGWKAVPAGAALEEGAQGPAVAALRRRLAVEGDLPTTAAEGAESAVFDEKVTAAVKRFQQRVGIEGDGKIGDDTLAALNVPAEERLRQIELNLERWRWMPGDFGSHYIAVNIPEYKLRAVRDGKTELEMNVIVGKRLHETPVFSDEMQFVVFNPEWNIPESIADSEVVPKIVSDPGYAAREGIEVVNEKGERLPASSVLGVRRVSTGSRDDDGGAEGDRVGFFARIFGRNRDRVRPTEGVTDEAETYTGSTTLPAGYRLRQAPGKENPLGQVKFMFPNEHNIYLHDTPGDQLFQAVDRGFSHGCIRLEKPLELADYVLQGKERLDAGEDPPGGRHRRAHRGLAPREAAGAPDLLHGLGRRGRARPLPRRYLRAGRASRQGARQGGAADPRSPGAAGRGGGRGTGTERMT